MEAALLPTTQEGKLDRLVEECAEVIKVICKGRRFGWQLHATPDGTFYDNRRELMDELKDLNHAILEIANDFPAA